MILSSRPYYPVLADKEELCVPVVMYHSFSEKDSRINRYVIKPERLAEDLEYLEKTGHNTVFISDIYAHYKNNSPLPEKPVILSFDDGSLSNYEYAFPLLRKYNAKAVIAPIGKACEEAENEKYRSPDWSECTWSQLAEMEASGLVETASHTYDLHKNADGISGAAAAAGESREEYILRLGKDNESFNLLMEKYIGKKAGVFVYPFGSKSDISDEVLRSMGYYATLDCEEKLNHISKTDDLYSLHRFLRTDDISSEEFFKTIGASVP